MNEEMSPPELLRAASRLIDRALGRLDTESVSCAGCGARRFENKVEASVARTLENMPATLRRQAGILAGSPVAVAQRKVRQALDQTIKRS